MQGVRNRWGVAPSMVGGLDSSCRRIDSSRAQHLLTTVPSIAALCRVCCCALQVLGSVRRQSTGPLHHHGHLHSMRTQGKARRRLSPPSILQRTWWRAFQAPACADAEASASAAAARRRPPSWVNTASCAQRTRWHAEDLTGLAASTRGVQLGRRVVYVAEWGCGRGSCLEPPTLLGQLSSCMPVAQTV